MENKVIIIRGRRKKEEGRKEKKAEGEKYTGSTFMRARIG